MLAKKNNLELILSNIYNIIEILAPLEKNPGIANKTLSDYIIPVPRVIYLLTFKDYLSYKYFSLRNLIPYYGYKVYKSL
jgi:hypothetical protein